MAGPLEGPLEGVRVLDLGRVVAAPTCAFYLASLGASVTRVEQPGGDISWPVAPFVGPSGIHSGVRGPLDIPIANLKRGRGKRSVVIDLHTDEGCQLVRRLAGATDVLVENFRPGVTGDMGLDYETLAGDNPGLVYCAMTGYGQEGPYREDLAMDLIVQARVGLMAKTGFPDGPPTKTGFTVGDQIPAVFAGFAIVAALRQRDVTGRGSFTDVAMFDVLTSLMWDEPLDLFQDEGLPPRVGNTERRGAPFGVYQTADGWIALMVFNQRQWTALTGLMGQPALAVELDSHAGRLAARDRVNEAVADWAKTRPTAALDRLLREANVPAAAVREPWSGRDDPQIAFRQVLEPLRHAAVPDQPAAFLGPRLPLLIDGRVPTTSPAEPMGASTDAVLSEVLGLSADELAALHARRIVRSDRDP